MKGIIIVNPNAHSGTYSGQFAALKESLCERLRESLNLEAIEWRETEYAGHARQIAHQAAQDGFQYIFAGGGDGTVNEVLNGIMESSSAPAQQRPALGVLPLGTSNDFFIALKAAEADSDLKNLHNETMPLDVGQIRFDGVNRYFCLTAGLGLFSWANMQYLEVSQVVGRRFAHIPAAIKTLLSYRFLPNVKITWDGKRTRRKRILSLIIDNSPSVAGGTPITPDARINDGYLDVCIVKPISLLRLLGLIFQISRQAHTHSNAVELLRVRELSLLARQPLPIHVDGELVPELESKARRMTVRVLPGALRVVMPSLCELVVRAAPATQQESPSVDQPVEAVTEAV